MKKNILLIFRIALSIMFLKCFQVSYSQTTECYKNFTTTTTYNNPWDWEYSAAQNSSSLWDMNPSGTYSPVVLYNSTPFHNTTGNPNLFNLGVPLIKDYQKEDGWELIKRDFGLGGSPVANPVVIFYNKFQSKLRVFVLITQQYSNDNSVSGSTVGGYIKLFFRNTPSTGVQEKATANLSINNEVIVALDQWNKQASYIAPNLFSNTLPFWMYADYTVQYDPCVCYFDQVFPVFRVEVVVHNSSTLSIDLRGLVEPIVSTPGVVNKTHNTAYSEIQGTFEGGYKHFSEGIELFNEFGNASTNLVNDETKTKIVNALAELKKFQNYIAIIPQTGVFINAGLNLTNFLLTGGKKENQSISASNIFSDMKVTLSGSGTIQTTSYKRFSEFYVPGVKADPTKDPQYYSDYNNPMGIINLLKTPELETREIDYLYYPSLCPKIKEYHLKEDIKYVLNPATQLQIQNIDHIQGAFLIKTKKGLATNCLPVHNTNGVVFPIEFSNKSLAFNAALNGYEVVTNSSSSNDISFRTPFVPINCLSGISFKTYIPFGLPNKPDVYLQLKIILKRTDADANSNTQDIFYIVTYKVNETPTLTEEDAGTYNFAGVSDEEFNTLNLPFTPSGSVVAWVASFSSPSPWTNFLGEHLINPVFSSGDVINGNLKAIGKVKIENGVIITSGSVVEATNEIEISPTNDYNPDVEFRLFDINSLCSSKTLVDFEATPTEVKNFCRGTTYQALSTFSKKEEETKTWEDEKNFLSIYPNPATNSINVDFELLEERGVEIAILDISGREVLKPLAESILIPNSYNYQIDVSSLPAGIYFVNVKKDGALFTEKLVIIR